MWFCGLVFVMWNVFLCCYVVVLVLVLSVKKIMCGRGVLLVFVKLEVFVLFCFEIIEKEIKYLFNG